MVLSRKKNAPPEDPIFQCIGMLARAFGPILTKHMHDLLDLMFASGLGEPLREALMVTAESIKPLQRTIQGSSPPPSPSSFSFSLSLSICRLSTS